MTFTVNLKVKVFADGGHHHVGYSTVGGSGCPYGEGGTLTLENVGGVNHTQAHTFSWSKLVSIGTQFRCYVRSTPSATNKKIEFYVNNKLRASQTRYSQCNNVTYVITGDDQKVISSPNTNPTYFETLDKLDQWSSAQYIPNSGNKLNL